MPTSTWLTRQREDGGFGGGLERAFDGPAVIALQNEALYQAAVTGPHVVRRDDDAEREQRFMKRRDDGSACAAADLHGRQLRPLLLELDVGIHDDGRICAHRLVICQSRLRNILVSFRKVQIGCV